MTYADPNLRKAAVLLRSLDADTAAVMLAQLSPAEATAIRAAIRDLGPIDPEEQADVLAEFRRTRPTASEATCGVELEISNGYDAARDVAPESPGITEGAQRFEFLAAAPITALIPFLVREHAQTIAVVLSHLAPARAAAVLAGLPDKLQADTIERLSALGDTDPESVSVLERELAAWMAKRAESGGMGSRRRHTMANILAAADTSARRGILRNLNTHNSALATQIAPNESESQREIKQRISSRAARTSAVTNGQQRATSHIAGDPLGRGYSPAPSPQSLAPLPRIEFDQLVRLDNRALTAVLREVDSNVLALALAGSRDELVDRICDQMPKSTARVFRRELRKLGPTRLSDVEDAQRVVANAASRLLAQGRPAVAAPVG